MLLGVCGALMFGDVIGGNVPTAIVTGRGLIVARIAVKRAAVEKLLQPSVVLGGEVARFARQRQLIATPLAVAAIELTQQPRVMIMNPTGDDSFAIAQGASHAELSSNGFPNERALVGELVQKLGQVFFHFECHDRGLGRRLTAHW
jgi:hypothetical protein